jgi:hypothetical protein
MSRRGPRDMTASDPLPASSAASAASAASTAFPHTTRRGAATSVPAVRPGRRGAAP